MTETTTITLPSSKKSLANDLKKSSWKLTEAICKKGWDFYENLGETLSESPDNDVFQDSYYPLFT